MSVLMQNTLIGALVICIIGLGLTSTVIVAIVKRKRIKATGWFHDAGFHIETDDDSGLTDEFRSDIHLVHPRKKN